MTARPLPVLRNVALVLLAMACFGNLYEAVVFVPFLGTLPPGSLTIGFTVGSPMLYFVPPGACLLVLLWTMVWLSGASRAALAAAVAFTLAAAATAIAVTMINPAFENPANTDLAGTVRSWELLNGLRLVLYVVAAVALLRVSRTARAEPV